MPSPHVFQRNPQAEMPVAVAGDGPYVVDREGRRYLDASGGAAVSCLGHSHAGVRAAIHEAVDALAYAHTGFFTTEAAERLAARLARKAPAGIERVYFVSGGSEAAEAAIKIARQYHLERGEETRHRVIARRQSYHGNTLGALAAGGNAWRRAPFEPLLAPAFAHVSPCHHWRWGAPGESPEAYGERLAAELEATIDDLGPETVAAFMAEPVVGATMGAVPAVPGYFARVREICDRYGILLVLDEVMCGMGRTGTLFAAEQEGVRPDVVLIAKGLGAGYQPIGAMLVSGAVHDAIAGGSGFFQHGHTYMGHPVACAAGNAVLDAIETEDLLANVVRQGDALQAALAERFADHPNVGDIRGRGLFRGIELVADRGTKAPLEPAARTHARIKAAALARGLMTYPMGGTIDGRRGDHVLLAPPFVVGSAEIEAIADRLADAVESVLPAARAA